MKHILLLTIFLISACSSTKSLKLTTELKTDSWKSNKLEAPESAYFDAKTNLLFVSNINGGPLDKDKNGYISIYRTSGELVSKKWVSGLSAPKGMRSAGSTLWVSDIDRVVSIDINSGKILKKYKVEGAKFLNDVAISSDGTVYISDMFTNTIFQLKDEVVSVLLKSEELENPNGLLVVNDTLFVTTWGPGLSMKDFSTTAPGRLLAINRKTLEITKESERLGNLDGLEVDELGHFYVSDWIAGKIFKINHNSNKVTLIYQGNQGVADIGINKNEIYIPKMLKNELSKINL
jgi:sugar lactone lactonase YvrE